MKNNKQHQNIKKTSSERLDKVHTSLVMQPG